jgi:hypothetical protein
MRSTAIRTRAATRSHVSAALFAVDQYTIDSAADKKIAVACVAANPSFRARVAAKMAGTSNATLETISAYASIFFFLFSWALFFFFAFEDLFLLLFCPKKKRKERKKEKKGKKGD